MIHNISMISNFNLIVYNDTLNTNANIFSFE